MNTLAITFPLPAFPRLHVSTQHTTMKMLLHITSSWNSNTSWTTKVRVSIHAREIQYCQIQLIHSHGSILKRDSYTSASDTVLKRQHTKDYRGARTQHKSMVMHKRQSKFWDLPKLSHTCCFPAMALSGCLYWHYTNWMLQGEQRFCNRKLQLQSLCVSMVNAELPILSSLSRACNLLQVTSYH